MSKVEQKRALFHGLAADYVVTVEAIVGGNFSNNKAVAKLVVTKTRLEDKDKTPENASATVDRGQRKYFYCGKPGHISKDCRKKMRDRKNEKKQNSIDTRKCYNCVEVGHFSKNSEKESIVDQVEPV